MKTRKTRTDARNTFTYKFADGTSVVLTPGVDGVTEADIAMLHRLDDCEVYNNVKNSKAPVEDWEKPILDEWKEQHPDEELPSRFHASLDYFTDSDDRDMDADQSRLFAECAVNMEETVSDDVARLREVVAQMPEELSVIYHRVMLDDENMTDVANDLHINRKTVYNRVQRTKQLIREGV